MPHDTPAAPPAADTARPDGARRLLLLEFVTHERWVFANRFYPFLKGFADELGYETLWLCFGSMFTVEKRSESELFSSMSLEGDDLERLAAHVARLRPTHVVVTHAISQAVHDVLRSGCDDVRVLSTSDERADDGSVNVIDYLTRDDPPPPGPDEGGEGAERPATPPRRADDAMDELYRTGWMLSWLGADEETRAKYGGRYIAGTVRPAYDGHMANDNAREWRPHLILLGGIACDHGAPVTKNPHYEGLDLSECTHDRGCAYCTWYRGPTSDPHTQPVAVAETQLRRVVETAGGGDRYCGELEVFDVRLFRRVLPFFEMVTGLDLPPTNFYFEPRVDRFMSVADRLEQALPLAAAKGHQVTLLRMGLETLVEEENFLYNKHVTLADIDGAPVRLRELRAAFPDAFDFDPTWGFITCSPWTTLEHLETLVDRAIERGFEPHGVWLYTPLLLYRGAPITVLAFQDGAIVQDVAYDPALLYEPAINQVPFDGFLHYRFKDEAMGEAFALIVRFCAAALRYKYPDTVFAEDPVYHDLAARPVTDTHYARPDLFAREAIAVVKAAVAGGAAPPFDRPALAAAAVRRYEAVLAGLDETERESPALRAEKGESAPARPPAPPDPERLYRLRFLFGAVCDRLGADVACLVGATEDTATRMFDVTLRVDGADYRLSLADPAEMPRAFFATDHFAVTHAPETPPRSDAAARALERVVRLFDRAAARHAPELLP